jgi:hypothetical protein
MLRLPAVSAMKGLIGDARDRPDLTPTESGKPGSVDGRIEVTMGVEHHFGCSRDRP